MSASELQNRLSEEHSPYLLQHRSNPVHWQPWGDEAFAAAKKLNRPIFLSIGYATCYWCHMMEKDSFELDDVAAVLNRNFIPIKVDREELPAVDKHYMDAVVAMTGHGGWPLSVFLDHERRAFFGGTFFWRPQFIQILEQLSAAWQREPERIAKAATELQHYLREVAPTHSTATTAGLVENFNKQCKQYFEVQHGGFGKAPKFPQAERLRTLLALKRNDVESAAMVKRTLLAMAQGGMYDHVGGGFHRYSVDNQWCVPHFEKMLYDNALLARAYIDGYRVYAEPVFKQVAVETLDYLLRDMRDPNGAFYTAEDAGEVNSEGKFYAFEEKDLKDRLTDSEFTLLEEIFELPRSGNFEGKLLLRLRDSQLWSEKNRREVQELLAKIAALRAGRERPFLDDKILVEWNALAITSLAEAYRTFGDRRYLDAAEGAARCIESKLLIGDSLYRRFHSGDVGKRAVLTDYAYLVEALLILYQATFNTQWYALALRVQQRQDRLFWDSEQGGYFLSDAESFGEIPVRSKDFADGALPSGNAVAAKNLLDLFYFTRDRSYRERSLAVTAAARSLIERHPFSYAGMLGVLFLQELGATEFVIASSEPPICAIEHTRLLLDAQYHPYLLFALADGSAHGVPELIRGKTTLAGKDTFHICFNNACKAPVTDIAAAFSFLEESLTTSSLTKK